MEEKTVKPEEVVTIAELVPRSAERYGESIALQIRRGEEFVKFSYREISKKVQAVAASLVAMGFKQGDKAGIIAENRPEWAIAYFSIVTAGGIIVPLDPQLKHKELGHILSVSRTGIVFASERYISVLEECREVFGLPRTIISMEPSEAGRHMVIEDLIEKGRGLIENGKVDLKERKPGLDDLLAIIFTSGTTGKSKGVMLTHRNVAFDTISASKVIKVIEGDNFISVLPLHHTFEATGGFLLPFYMGAKITYARSLKSKEIIEDLKDSNATILLAVPLLYEKMLKALHRGMAEQSGFIKAVIRTNMVFVRGVKKLFHAEVGGVLFKSLRKKAGLDSIRIMISGGAALPLWVCDGFRELGFNLFQGYGLTETSPVTNVTPLEKIVPASVGPPIPGIEMRVVNADEFGVGEIAVKGPIVMRGYFQDEEETRKVLREGWFYTGDLGKRDSDNYYYITGRKKSVIVSAAGKNIYPEEVEDELLISDFIEEILVTGRINPDTKREEVHAIIYPNWETLDAHCSAQGIEQTDRWINEFFKSEIEERCKELADYKRVKSFSIREEEFPKTTTKKIKRFLFQEDVLKAN